MYKYTNNDLNQNLLGPLRYWNVLCVPSTTTESFMYFVYMQFTCQQRHIVPGRQARTGQAKLFLIFSYMNVMIATLQKEENTDQTLKKWWCSLTLLHTHHTSTVAAVLWG